MARKIKPGTRLVSGILLVDKPAGETSNRTLQKVRRLYAASKAGHTGTLDPMATGMLPVCFGPATRVSGLMLESSKQYRVTARFGTATDTGDASGKTVATAQPDEPTRDKLATALSGLRGRIEQVPPMYSALKHQGKRLYELARAGEEVERKPRAVEIFELELEQLCWPELVLRVFCSKGTYIRTLVADLAASLGSVAHVAALRRLAVGPFAEEQMISWDRLEAAAESGLPALDRLLLGIDAALMDRPAVTVSESDAGSLINGQHIRLAAGAPEASVRVYGPGERFIGLGNLSASGELRPARIFVVETLG